MEQTLTVKRQSESWMSGDDRLVEAIPLYCGDERIEDMPTWAMYTATEAVCRDLARQLIGLFRQSPCDYYIGGGHFKVSLKTSHHYHRVVVDLALVVSDEGRTDGA